jgi:hypothetical protein
LSKPSEGSFEKRKRKIWKIIVPIVVVVVLTPLLMYVYAYITVEDSYSKSWDTIRFPEVDETMLETEFTDEMTIHNPTGTNIRLVTVKVDVWIDGNKLLTIRDTDVYLPAGGSATISCTWRFDSQIMNSILSPFYNQTISVENVAFANVLFIPITRTFIYDNTEIIH